MYTSMYMHILRRQSGSMFSFSRPPSTERRMEGAWPRACFYDAEVSGSGTAADADGILLVFAARVLRVQRFWPPHSGGGEPALWAWSTTDPAAHNYLLQYKQKEFAARECTCARCTCRSLLPLSLSRIQAVRLSDI